MEQNAKKTGSTVLADGGDGADEMNSGCTMELMEGIHTFIQFKHTSG